MAIARSDRGFSLIEILISVILVGLSITALVVANNSFTMANAVGADLSTAEFLIEQIRELTAMFPVADPDTTIWTTFGPEEPNLAGYDDVDDLDNAVYSPPIGADRVALNDFALFSQQVVVEKVDPSNFDQVVADTNPSNFVRVTVSVSMNADEISSASWIRARY